MLFKNGNISFGHISSHMVKFVIDLAFFVVMQMITIKMIQSLEKSNMSIKLETWIWTFCLVSQFDLFPYVMNDMVWILVKLLDMMTTLVVSHIIKSIPLPLICKTMQVSDRCTNTKEKCISGTINNKKLTCLT